MVGAKRYIMKMTIFPQVHYHSKLFSRVVRGGAGYFSAPLFLVLSLLNYYRFQINCTFLPKSEIFNTLYVKNLCSMKKISCFVVGIINIPLDQDSERGALPLIML